MRSPSVFAALLAASSFMISVGASAQTRYDSYDYHFEEDDLVGETMSTPPPMLRVPAKGRRVLLIRPRVTFVAELLGSVEDV